MFRSQPLTILLVEDDLGHARLIERNLRRVPVMHDLVVLHDGQEALNYLFKELGYANAQHPTPRVVLLDLNLPGFDGYQVLTRLKSNERTKNIVVVVLTTTDDPHEIERCYALGCNAYITKPVDSEQFIEVMQTLGLFLSIVKLPRGA